MLVSIYRDARITSIYEGTTQLQTVAAIRYVTNGSDSATLRDYEQVPCSEEMQPLMDRIKEMTNKFEACTNAVKEAQNQELLDFVARRLYEMAAVCIMSHLIIQDATKAPELFGKVGSGVCGTTQKLKWKNTLTSSVSSRQKSWKATANKRIAWTKKIAAPEFKLLGAPS